MHFLGDITLAGFVQPNALETTSEASYAEHPKLQGKPSLQRVGSKVDTLTLNFAIHRDDTIPEDFIQRLTTLQADGTVLPLHTEAGDALGDWVIQSITTSRQHSAPDGSIIDCTIAVSLLEWVTVDGIAERSFAERRQGFAVGTQGIQNPDFRQALEYDAMASTLAIGGDAAAIDSSLFSATASPEIEAHTRVTVAQRLAKIIADANFARDTINAFGGQKYTDTRGMETDLLSVIASATTMQGLVETASIADLRGMIQALIALNSTLRTSAQILSKYAGSRS